MGGPVERPVSSDSAPEQSAGSASPATIGTGSGGVGPAHDAPYSTQNHGMFGVSGSGDTSGFGGLVREPWTAPATERPYGSYFDDIVDALYDAYPQAAEAIDRVVVDRNELTLHLKREHLVDVARTLRDNENLRFELCSSVSGVDYLGSTKRLHSVTHLTSMTYRYRLRLEVSVSVEDPHVPSLTGVYPTTDWQERETFDMFGIVYDGHPALTRILMPDDWDGHPQRKDYPLGGIPVQYKGAAIPPADERRAYK
ncbi:NADH-quinone oxidoreductase subunit C [uncultured Jatrophihabitans sp.]|uniref:NADH-quinone oxidoreductase subunit C n=1 Tax=uncultured Jatrophihabitans sp. TaxID=1610747 RepID=UPI0035CAFD2B